MKFIRKFVYILLSFLEILVAFFRKAFEIIEFIFSNFFTYILLPTGVICVVAYVIYIVFGWGTYGYKKTLDYVSDEIMINLKCKKFSKKRGFYDGYYQVSKSIFNDNPHILKYFYLPEKKFVVLAEFEKKIKNDNIYEFWGKSKVFQIDRKSLKMTILEKYPKKFIKDRKCSKVSQEEIDKIIQDLKKDGKEF